MRIFKTKRFAKWAKKERITDDNLCRVVREMEAGLTDAKLSDFVYKKRIATQGKGKRGSTRTILAFKANTRAFYIFGYAKNEIENITEKQLRQLKILAERFLSYSDKQLQCALNGKEIFEVGCHE